MTRNLFFLVLSLVLALTLVPAESALAGGADNCSAGQLPFSMTLNTEVTSDLPVGSAIPPVASAEVSADIDINCSADWNNDRDYCIGGPGWAYSPTNNSTPIETSVPGVYSYPGLPSGVGYQFLNEAGQPLPLDAASRHSTDIPIRTGNQTVPLRLRLVKTSNALSTGSFAISMILSCNTNEWANRNKAGSQINVTVNSRVITQTCSLSNADTLVQLPKVARSAFKGVGSSAGNTPFTLDFQCDASADARFSISDVANLSNASDALGLQAGSTASGLGVRLLNDGNPVHLAPNQVFDAGGSEYPLRNLDDSERTISLSFAAEYLQTQDAVTAGTVQAQAVVTIAYN